MTIRIALAGNPNCGKTTMFNNLTGANQYVGNWPGVTVEKKEGKLKGKKDVIITDLPGIYSLSPYTLEEVVSRDYILNEHPDVIVNLVDATNIERNLYLTTQLIETGVPVVIALNMADLLEKREIKIDTERLSMVLGCPIIETSALKGDGLNKLMEEAIRTANTKEVELPADIFSADLEKAIENVKQQLPASITEDKKRWYAVKLLENDSKVSGSMSLGTAARSVVEDARKALESKHDNDMESIVTDERYQFIQKVVKTTVKKAKGKLTVSDRIDQIVTNRILGIPIFIAVMFIVYYISVSTIGTFVTDWTNDVFVVAIQDAVSGFLESLGASEMILSLVVEGIIGGLGAVLGFVPQMAILFLFLSILEDCGYMVRIAFVMDRVFRHFGLSGKSFVPMLIGFGCSVPAIMSTRTLSSERDRKMTIILTPFMSCSAKLPIYGMITAAFFPQHAAVVMLGVYLIGILVAILCGLLFKQTLFNGNPVPFVMELPAYRIPDARSVLMHMWEKAKDFLHRAFTIIFAATIIIWFLQSYDFSFHAVSDASASMLAVIGEKIAWIFEPLGFADWRASSAIITGITAKESVVSTLSILTGASTDAGLSSVLQTMFTPLSAFAFLCFTVLYMPCVAAFAATKRELGTLKEALFAVLFQTGVAYIVALIIYQAGSVFL